MGKYSHIALLRVGKEKRRVRGGRKEKRKKKLLPLGFKPRTLRPTDHGPNRSTTEARMPF